MGFSNTFENYIGSDISQWKNEKKNHEIETDKKLNRDKHPVTSPLCQLQVMHFFKQVM